VHTGCWRS
jgi:hypothetical protein